MNQGCISEIGLLHYRKPKWSYDLCCIYSRNVSDMDFT